MRFEASLTLSISDERIDFIGLTEKRGGTKIRTGLHRNRNILPEHDLFNAL